MKRLLCVLIIFITHQASIVFAQCGPASNITQDLISYYTDINSTEVSISLGQSFVATCSGNIEAITIATGNIIIAGEIMLTLYEGVNPDNPLDSVIVTIGQQNELNTLLITLPTPIFLTSGNEYAFILRDLTGSAYFGAIATNPYAGGQTKVLLFGSTVYESGFEDNIDLYFQIHYQDNVPPIAVCENITVELDETGTVVLFPSLVGAGSSDDSGFFTMSMDTTFTCSDLGANPVVLTVNDASGNSATCNAIITVVDLLAPEIACPVNQDTTLMVGDNYLLPDFLATEIISITDNCSTIISNTTQTPSAGTQLPLGINEVTITAEDENGNTSSCSFEINVGTLSLEDFEVSGIEIYPNPATDRVTIKNSKGHNLDQVTLYDLIGNLLFTTKSNVTKSEQQLDLSQLNAGIYFVVIKTVEELFTQQLFKN